jgi:GT2 family glycosyltransferase
LGGDGEYSVGQIGVITYSHPPKVQLHWLHGHPLLSVPEGGRVAIDHTLLSLWKSAEGQTLKQVIDKHQKGGAFSPEAIRAALACLAEAGLLQREISNIKPAETLSTPISYLPQGKISLVSAIIVNYNSQDWLDECLASLEAQTCPVTEIILVDNGSLRDPAEWLQIHYPGVRSLRIEPGHGLAYALNRGIELATGDYLLLLNPDLTLQPDALEQMLNIIRENPDCAAVAPKLRFLWAPAFLNGLGNHVNPFSWGADNGLGHLDLGQFDAWTELPSACFAAALLSRSAWQSTGPLDEGFPMYYEDVEWCYRARLLGRKILAAPRAIGYHALGQRVHTGQSTLLSSIKLKNVTYGRLRFARLLLGKSTFLRFLNGYALADLAYFLVGLLRLDLAQSKAILQGWRMFLLHRRAIQRQHYELQSRRVLNDDRLLALQGMVPPPMVWHGLPELTWDSVIHTFLPLIQSRRSRPMPEFPSSAVRLLIISHDIVNEKMAGPGMRYLEMALSLVKDLTVTLAVPGETSLKVPGVRLETYRFEQPASLQRLAQDCDVVLLSSFILEKFPFLKDLPIRRVIDLYDPLVLENLHLYQSEPIDLQTSLNTRTVQIMNRLVRLGDYFICGNVRQRDFWIGVLAANGRINPHTFAQDSSLRTLIDVVGVGFPEQPPQSHPLLRGIHAAFPADSKIVLWGGGIWDWLDPLSLVKAWPSVIEQVPQARLVFLGTRHPNPLVPPHKMADKVQTLADTIGEKDRTIFFFEWLSYGDREALLCEADLGVVLHPVHLETRYSIRTRVFDYLWAKLPVLVTSGDVTSEWVAEYGLGRVVPPLDEKAVAQALIELLAQPKSSWAAAFTPLKDKFTWSQVVAPLRQYCLSGTPASDRGVQLAEPSQTSGQTNFRSGMARARFIWRNEGFGAMLRQMRRYLQWRLSQF